MLKFVPIRSRLDFSHHLRIHLGLFCVTIYDISLSLAMFEALRGVRDAVAPESGNLGAASTQQQPQSAVTTATSTTANTNPEDTTDVDNMWHLYRSGDATVTSMMQKVYPLIITRRDEFVRIYTKMEMERKDSELVKTFATMVLDKFDEIRHGVQQIPGLHRTRSQQMEYIQELLEQNAQLQQQLDQAYQQARQRQMRIYQLVEHHTNRALGLDDGNATTTTMTTTAAETTVSTTDSPPESALTTAMEEFTSDEGWMQELEF